MKKIFTILSIIYSFLSPAANAQGIYQLWGSVPLAGTNNAGVIFSSKYDATGYKVKHVFTNNTPGKAYYNNKPVLFNNKFYALLTTGGMGQTAMIGEFDPATNAWIRKADLLSINGGSDDNNGLTVLNGKIYGLSTAGGVYDKGVLFEFEPGTGSITALHNYGGISGEYPSGSLTAYNNKLYGVTKNGGSNDNGVVYEFNPIGNLYVQRANFDEATTGYLGNLALTVYNNKLWGVTIYGALNTKGALYSFDPASGVLSKKIDFDNLNISRPAGSLTVLNNKLYGATDLGGPESKGGIFEYNPATNQAVVKRFFTGTDATLDIHFTVYNNKLYSSSSYGGANNKGAIFSYDPSLDLYQPYLSFSSTSGSEGTGYLSLYNNKFYGLTTDGGTFEYGSLFSFDPAANQFQALVYFGDTQLRTPTGPLLYYNNKFYGTTTFGGTHQDGGIYEYDPLLDIRTDKVSFERATTGRVYFDGGFTLLNNKFYAVATFGGAFNGGTLLEYDPATNTLLNRHDFDVVTGSEPHAQLTVFNGKLYGVCSKGGINDKGIIYEFDPTTNIYSEKVILNDVKGSAPLGRMTVFNNKLYGVTSSDGLNYKGTVFEYSPLGNIFTKRADFFPTGVANPYGGLTVSNGKLYGISYRGGAVDSGAIYQFDPVSFSLTKKGDLDYTTGTLAENRMTSLNNKLFGMPNAGGSINRGTIISFNPTTGILEKKMDFTKPDGSHPITNELSPVPARTAPGLRFTCQVTQGIDINAANANEWIQFTDDEGRAVAEINANGNILGLTSVGYYTHDGITRKTAGGISYLDRNITIQRANDPITPVSIRLYIRKDEFDKFKATPGLDITTPADLTVFNNDDECTPTMDLATVPIPATQDSWNIDYVYSADVLNLTSSFYFGKAGAVVPVKLLSFTGKKETTCNKLVWQASCTEETLFSLEKSSDGLNFSEVHNLNSGPQNGSQPFSYSDCNITSGKTFYRLKMKENNSAGVYSNQIVIDRNEMVENVLQIIPNPVLGNTAQLRITTGKNTDATIAVVDVAGKKMLEKKVKINAGINNLEVNVGNFAAGIYFIIYKDGNKKEIVKMVKQ